MRTTVTGIADRLTNAWADCGGPALQIGMDTPQIDPEVLDESLSALDASPGRSVLGPAQDGGWWAIGLLRPDPRVFRGVPMSTPTTVHRTSGEPNVAPVGFVLAKDRLVTLRFSALPAFQEAFVEEMGFPSIAG